MFDWHNIDQLIEDVGKLNEERNDRERPYDGQPWTTQGERGKATVAGLTMRDIADCFIMGWLQASPDSDIQAKVGLGTWAYGDVYLAGDVDPIAVEQNMACWIERMMGIFPNIPTGDI